MTVLFLVLVTLGASAFVYSQDWPMIGNDPGNTGYTPSSGPSVGNLQWNYTTGARATSPAVADGKVYVSSDDGNIYCLDADTGASIWIYDWAAGGRSWTSPAVADNKVYIGSQGLLVCLNADWGFLIWDRVIGGDITSPIVADGKVYVGSTNQLVYCLNADTGWTEWFYAPLGHSPVYSSPAVADGNVCWVHGEEINGKLTCLKLVGGSPGPSEWTLSDDIFNVMLSPAVADNKIYVCSERAVYCFNADNALCIWEFRTPDDAEHVTSSPTVVDGEVYIGYENRIYCLDAYTGAQIWNYTTGFDVTSTAVADEKVYVCSDDGKIYCLNADTGAWIWEFSTEANEEFMTSFPAVADGKVYIGSSNGKVYCLGSTIDERIASLEAENAALEAENAALRSDLDALNARVSETEIKFMILPGDRLNIWNESVGEYTISADEITNVWHGFKSNNSWGEYTEEQKTEFLSTAQWRFTVDGEEVPLDHVVRLQGGIMWSLYYRVFPPGYFKIGTHRLVGEWHSMEDGVWTSDVREVKLRVK